MQEFILKKDHDQDKIFYGSQLYYDYKDQQGNLIIDTSNQYNKNKYICAKTIEGNNYIRYEPPHLYNPYSQINSNYTGLYNDTIKFKKVDKSTIDTYINFLRTKNMSQFNNAQRKGLI